MNRDIEELFNGFIEERAHTLMYEKRNSEAFMIAQESIDNKILLIKKEKPELNDVIEDLLDTISIRDALYIEESYKAGFKDCYNFINN